MSTPPPGTPPAPAPDDYYVPRGQNFDVILLKKGVNGMEAKPDDFKRISVTADSVAQSQEDPEVVAALKDFDYVQATAPGHRTEFEIGAQKRAYSEAYGETDRTKI